MASIPMCKSVSQLLFLFDAMFPVVFSCGSLSDLPLVSLLSTQSVMRGNVITELPLVLEDC